jgi:hypothetical protein
MREIEKIGLMLRAILGGLMNIKGNTSLTIENQFEKTSEMLLQEAGLDLKKLLTLDETEAYNYLLQFEGINPENIELLAETMTQFGISETSDRKRMYFQKAIQLYELCAKTDKTFSLERQRKIAEIKSAM